ncbi:hypothetical protein E2C01_093079 [Portunus trituberculatus]|uniref:Uncharacterized protein n=1 Tax=Portunus trituberculatus TaxID=210409 RepID=A0A5B7JLW1_PORTR|nr:hypothetical protein [Portunus trituberculatus]
MEQVSRAANTTLLCHYISSSLKRLASSAATVSHVSLTMPHVSLPVNTPLYLQQVFTSLPYCVN